MEVGLDYVVFAFDANDPTNGFKYIRIKEKDMDSACQAGALSIYEDMLKETFTEEEADYFLSHASFIPVLASDLGERTPEEFYKEEIMIERKLQ